MDGVQNNISAGPNYRSTKNGAIGGAVVGVAGSGIAAGACRAASFFPLKLDNSVAAKRSLISGLQKMYSSTGLDMSKTTVSKFVKSTAKKVLNPLNVAKKAAAFAVVGAAVGFVIDNIKNGKAEKAAKAEKTEA